MYFKEKATVKALFKFKMVKLDINISLYELFLSYNQIYFFFSKIIFAFLFWLLQLIIIDRKDAWNLKGFEK